MAGNIRGHIAGLLQTSKRHSRYVGVLALLAVVVALGVTMGLRRNGRAATVEQTVLDCHAAAGVAHTHNADCYVGGDLVCPLQERELHVHGDSCYDEAGNLVCGKEEASEEHVHGDGCFKTVTVTVDDPEPAAEAPAEDEGPDYAQAEAEAAPMPSQTFEEKVDLEGKNEDASDDLIVRVEAPEGALPKGTTMRVSPITAKKYIDSAKNEVKDKTQAKVEAVQAVDITFIHDGKEVEPEKNVHVSMRYADVQYTQDKAIEIVHVDDEYNADIVGKKDEQTEKDEVTFESDKFSVYAMVITTQHIDSNGNAYDVTVSYGPEAKIPDGSTLRVTEIASGDAEYDRARNAVLADKLARGESVDLSSFGFAAMDISIIDPSGNEIEPSATVKVDLKVKSLPEVEDLAAVAPTMEVQHHVETGSKVIVETVAGGSADASFKQATDAKVIADNKGDAVDPNGFDESSVVTASTDDNAVETSFNTEVFSTYTISYYYNYYSKNIHYVDTNGNPLTPTMTPNFNARHQFLIYDIEGYEYDSTHVGSRTGTTIQPILRASDRNGLYYSGNIQYRNGNSWSDLNNNDIYVVYKAKPTPTQGGTPTLKPVDPDDKPAEPTIHKDSEPNGDGTSDLSLSILGHTKDREVEKLADVIVVFDISGSMDRDLSDTDRTDRIDAAKSAVNTLVDNLAKKKNSNGNPLVRMSLISFSTTANNVRGLTDLTDSGVSDYKGAVEGLQTGGGTNWDYALQLANEQEVDSGRATFVIFVTDGDPTFRNTRTNTSDADLDMYTDGTYQYYRQNHVFGDGQHDYDGHNYDAAIEEGQAIRAKNKYLYTIGISSDVTKVSNFNRDAGGNGAFLASNTAELNQAFSDIEAAIAAKMGVSDIQMTDGITEMTQTVDKSGLTTTDGSFTYWKKAKDATSFVEWDPSSERCAEAEYDEASGAVEWNMGTNFMPEDGATYKVTWKVWPSQEAYDILAKCMNDPAFYDTLNASQKAQITRTGTSPNYSYTLRTNEPGAATTYKDATKSGDGITTEGDAKSLPFNEVNPLGLASSQIKIQKRWDNQLDPKTETVTGSHLFPVKADGVSFGEGVLLSDPQWQNTYYISTGLMTTNPYMVYEHGHDYTIEEPSDLAYHWDFKSDVYHPMVIDNQTVNLVKVDAGEEYDYEIDGKFYRKLSGEAVLTATNERRSNLNISKTVVDKDGNHFKSDQAFTFTVTVHESHDEEVWLSAYDTAAGETVKDPSIVTGNGVQYQASDGYFHAPSGTTLTLTMKDGWNYRFTNLSVGSTYTIEENSPVPDGYAFKEIAASATNGATAGTVTGQKTEGTIDKSNSVYTAAYTNRTNTTTLKFRKVGSDGKTPLAGAVVNINKGAAGVDGSPFTTTTEDIELTLLDGVYQVKETKAPAGYNILSGDYYFKTNDGTVTITDASGAEKSYEDFTKVTEDGVIVLKLKNNPGKPLPMTGGPGTALFNILGSAIATAAVLTYLLLSRRTSEGRSWV